MGVTAKPTGKFLGYMTKLRKENENREHSAKLAVKELEKPEKKGGKGGSQSDNA